MKEINLLEEIKGILSTNDKRRSRYAADIDWLNAWERLWEKDKIRVGVIGITSTGKSTLINAILGEELLSVAVRPSSNQLVSCSYAKTPFTTIFFTNGEKKTINNIVELKDIILRYSDERHNERNKEKVAQLEVSVPSFSLGEDVLLVDSPGLDATGYEVHEALTLETLLPTVDVVIYVTTVKSEVDSKMKMVLDTIARYNCPVMIVQNMLDAVRASVDGTKSAADVAKERLNRVVVAVNQSRIRDKEDVRIAQISANYAMQYRCAKDKRLADVKKFEFSRYDGFIAGVKELINNKRPEIEAQRIDNILCHIDELIIQEDKRNKNVSLSMIVDDSLDRIDSEIDKALDEAHKNLKSIIHELKDIEGNYASKSDDCCMKILGLISRSKKYDFTSATNKKDAEKNINKIKEFVKTFETTVLDEVRGFSNKCIDVSNRLNIPARDLWSYNGLPRIPEIRVQTTTKTVSREVSKDDFLSNTLRLITFDIWDRTETVYETIEVLDKTSNDQAVLRYLQRLQSEYSKTIGQWYKSASATTTAIKEEIKRRKIAIKEKEQKVLDAKEWHNTKEALNKCIKGYRKEKRLKRSRSKVGVRTTGSMNNTRLIKSSAKIAKIYKLSEKYILSIQRAAFEYALRIKGRDSYPSIIVSNSYDDCTDFLYRFFQGKKFDDSKGNLIKISEDLWVTVAPSDVQIQKLIQTFPCVNTYLLVNGLRFHTESETSLRNLVKSKLRAHDALFLSIQDFDALVNGEGVTESIRTVGLQQTSTQSANKGLTLINHNNPVYNMAAIHAQTTEGKLRDETIFYGSIAKKFPGLVDETVKKQINSLTRGI